MNWRFFPTLDPLLSSLCSVACHNDLLDLCYIRNLPGVPTNNAEKIFSMNWRFFPTLDPQVDVYVSRDLDSTMTSREAEAVKEWMNSGKGIHSMRDHPWHGVEMVGASWGARPMVKSFEPCGSSHGSIFSMIASLMQGETRQDRTKLF